MSTQSIPTASPHWASRWLCVAGICNLAWGTLTILWPHLPFDLAGAERLNYSENWQCVGMIAGLNGIGSRQEMTPRLIQSGVST